MSILSALSVLVRSFGSWGAADTVMNIRRVRAVLHDTSYDETPLEKGNPVVHLDMNLSSSFDELNPDHSSNQPRPVWLPMAIENKDDTLAFYTDLLQMVETQAPEYAANSDLLWLTNGIRTLCLGPEPTFAYVVENPPSFRLPQLDEVNAGLIAAGHVTSIDDSLAYARRMTVTDPAGNELAFVGA